MSGVYFRSPIGGGRISHAAIDFAVGAVSNVIANCVIDIAGNGLGIGTAASIVDY